MNITITVDKESNIPLETVRYHIHQQLLEAFNIEILSDGNFYIVAPSRNINPGYYNTTYVSADGDICFRKLKANSFYHAQSMAECKHEVVTSFFCNPDQVSKEYDD